MEATRPPLDPQPAFIPPRIPDRNPMKLSRALQLHRETLLNLSGERLLGVRGGIPADTQTCDACLSGACPSAPCRSGQLNCSMAETNCQSCGCTTSATTTRPSTTH